MSVLKENIKNFGLLKSAYNGLMAESILTKDKAKRTLFKKYVDLLKESEILKTQFLVYTNIANKVETDVTKATEFVKESIKLFDRFSTEAIYEANEKLANLLMLEGKEFIDELSELNKNISTLIFAKKTPDTIDIIIEARSKVVDYIINNKPKEIVEAIDFPNSGLSRLLVDKYNAKYSALDESEKQVLKAIIDSGEENKKEVYSHIVQECIELINEKLGKMDALNEPLTNSDLTAKDKLLRVKEKLLNDKKEINEDFIKNVSKLVQLRTTLKETK